ncbi:hypothetical protein GCM10019016_010780 [Streptomyces prasinosporus]|uniref:Uncharacterized protein n=1 Tax=Streptomyces prasinosporus TaxID=68256 RepID=A0ABP6TFJ4_9ACTN|nr:hypothetical protein GCM10010332_73820 [Streptomyces albogriseolus]
MAVKYHITIVWIVSWESARQAGIVDYPDSGMDLFTVYKNVDDAGRSQWLLLSLRLGSASFPQCRPVRVASLSQGQLTQHQ